MASAVYNLVSLSYIQKKYSLSAALASQNAHHAHGLAPEPAVPATESNRQSKAARRKTDSFVEATESLKKIHRALRTGAALLVLNKTHRIRTRDQARFLLSFTMGYTERSR